MDNNYIIIFLIIITSIYYLICNPNIFNNNIFKFALFISIIYISSYNIIFGIIVAFVVLILFQNIISKNIADEINEFENFEQYLDSPLQNNSNLEPINPNVNFNIVSPNEINLHTIQEGKQLVEKSYELKKDADKNNDDNLKNIANDTYINGMTMIHSGLNNSINNTYDKFNTSNNLNSNYVSYDNTQNNYSKNKQIFNTYNELLNELSQNKDIIYKNNNEFQLNVNNMYKTQLKLLSEINENNKSCKNYTKIKKQIELINDIINNNDDNKKIEEQMNLLISLFN